MEAREIRGSINREEEVERKRDEVERWRGENGWREGGQHRREEELLRASRAVNILQAWIREVMKCGMGEGFLRASYRVKERKGAGQLDNTALIKNICRWRGRKTASGGREMTAFCFICLSGQVSVFVFFFVWFLISVLISSRLFWRDPTCGLECFNVIYSFAFVLDLSLKKQISFHAWHDSPCCNCNLCSAIHRSKDSQPIRGKTY